MSSGLTGLVVAVSVATLSACSGTTYGTGTTAEQQLVEDVSGVLSLAPKQRPRIDYSPRPGLVLPPSTEVLPPPQDSVASTGNPAWPESPEQRLARIRAEATANQDNPFYRSNVVRDVPPSQQTQTQDGIVPGSNNLILGGFSTKEQREEVLRRRQAASPSNTNVRRYLSDPPLDLRQPAPTAPADDLGMDEAKKERQAKAASSSGGLRKLIPWLD